MTCAARVLREVTRVEVARLLARHRVAEDITQAEVAASCGVRERLVGEWEDRARPHTPDLAALVLMPRVLAVAMLREIADRLGLVVAEKLTEEACVGTLHELVRTTSRLEATFAEATDDDVLSADELRQIDRDACAVLAHVTRISNAAKARLRELATPIRRVP